MLVVHLLNLYILALRSSILPVDVFYPFYFHNSVILIIVRYLRYV